MLSSSFVHSYLEIFKLWREHATRQKTEQNKTNKQDDQIPRQMQTATNIQARFSIQGWVARSMVSANHWLRGIKTYRLS